MAARRAPMEPTLAVRRLAMTLACGSALALFAVTARAGDPPAPARADTGFAATIAKEEAVVVGLSATHDADDDDEPFASDDVVGFGTERVARSAPWPAPRPTGAVHQLASGLIVGADGEILTNAHVVSGAERPVVRLADGRRYAAEVVGVDRVTDIALVRIAAHGLPVASVGRSAELVRGEWVVAIGSPFGLDHSATAGIVSAAQRFLPGSAVPLIQSDVAINPGSSGGPLFNLRGEVVGINSMIFSTTGGYMGVSFAVPIDVALEVAAELRTTGRVARGHLGATVQEVTPELATSFGLAAPAGVVVLRTLPGSPAERAGLRSGDIVLGTGADTAASATQVHRAVAAAHGGDRLQLNVWRGGALRRLDATVEAQAVDRPPARPAPPPDPRLGLNLGEMPVSRRERAGLDGGLPVLEAHGAAFRGGVRADDVIVAVGDRPIRAIADFDAALAAAPPGRPHALLVLRGRTLSFLAIDADR